VIGRMSTVPVGRAGTAKSFVSCDSNNMPSGGLKWMVTLRHNIFTVIYSGSIPDWVINLLTKGFMLFAHELKGI